MRAGTIVVVLCCNRLRSNKLTQCFVYLGMAETLKTLPLTDSGKEHLIDIYSTRRRTFLRSYGLIMLIAFLCCFRIDYRTQYGTHRVYKEDSFDKPISREAMYLVNIAFLCGTLAIAGSRIYSKRILRFKRDIENGVKEMVPYTIVSKRYFEHTGEYFFSFDDPNYMHYEVEAAMYMQCCEGDTLYVSRAPLSKYVFDKDGRFSLI